MEEDETTGAASRTSLGSAGAASIDPKKVRSGGIPETSEGKKNRNSLGSGPKARKKQFKEQRVRYRNMEGMPEGSTALLHKQASFSEVQKVTVVVPQMKLRQRIAALDALEKALAKKSARSTPEKRQRGVGERTGLLFSTSEFWEELRAAVRDRKECRDDGRYIKADGASAARRGAPTPTQLQAERARIERARKALPLLIQEVKTFTCPPDASASPQQALDLVSRLLDKIDLACETAFPTTHATGRMLTSGDGCPAYKHSCGKTRWYGHGGWSQSVRSCSVLEPEVR